MHESGPQQAVLLAERGYWSCQDLIHQQTIGFEMLAWMGEESVT